VTDYKIPDLTNLAAGSIAADDLFEVDDVSDNVTMTGGAGSNKKIRADALFNALWSLRGITPAASKIPYFTSGSAASVLTLDTDTTLAANDDTTLASQKATKTYADTKIAKSLVDAKGDLLVGTADNTVARKAVAVVNGKTLIANSGDSTGLDWIQQFSVLTHSARLAAGPSGLTQLIKESDTGVIYLDALGAFTIWNNVGFVGKTADETVTSSTTLQDDDALTFPVEASEVWSFEGMAIFTSANATMDMKWSVAGPTSPTSAAFWRRPLEYPTTPTGSAPNAVSAFGAAITSGGGANATIGWVVEFGGWIVNGSNAGNVRFQWAQNVSDAGALKVLKGSWIKPQRIA
jgi:hypothetical protein